MIASYFPKQVTLGKRWISCMTFLFISHGIWGQIQTYTGSGTFIVPAGVTSINVECWGGGGAGGGNTTNADGGGGGGGGAYSRSTLVVTPGASYTVTVGNGGTGSTGNGTSGGDTWFNTNATILAKGGTGGSSPVSGNGGVAGSGGASGSSIGNVVYSGGNGGTGRNNSTGRGGPGGSSAGTGAAGTSGPATWSTLTAGAAPAGGGIGGDGGGTGVNGAPGSVPGGGGGGSGDNTGSNRSGGNGAPGQVIISWTPPVFYSQGSGNPGTTSNWNTIPAGGGYSPANFITDNQTFIVQSGHNMSTTGTWSVSGTGTFVQISNNASITANNAISFSAATVFQIDNGGTYFQNHNTNNNIFAGTNTLGSTSTVNYMLAGAQTIAGINYGNLTFSGSGAKTLQAGTASIGGNLTISGTASTTTVNGLTISGSLNIGNGTTFTAAGFALTVNGTTTIGTGTSGTLSINSATGTKTFNGIVTINSGGAITQSAAAQLEFGSDVIINGSLSESGTAVVGIAGSLTNNGTYTAGTGIHTFSGTNKSMNGTLTIPSVTVIGTYTNNGTLTVTTALAGSGSLANGSGGFLNIYFTGAVGITTLTATAAGNTVEYGFAGTQTIKPTTYNSLFLSNSGVKTIGTAITVSGNLTINGTASASLSNGTTSSANTLTLGSAGQPSGSFGGTGSAATFKNSTYFAGALTGILNVSAGSCAAGSWIGGVSTDWSTASNWCDGTVPTSATNVIINSIGNQPVIATAAFCNNITINTGATLVITGANSLTVSGNWLNSGSFTANTSTVIYDGPAAQTVGTVSYHNLTISGSGAKTLTGATVNAVLSMEGTATTTGTTPGYGAGSTLQYKGSAAQTTGIEMPGTFNGTGGIIVNNAAGIILAGNVTVSTVLSLTQGNVTTGVFTLALTNGTAGSLTRISGTVIGKFRRTISTTPSNDYIFPVGTAAFYRPAVMNFSSLSAGTDLTAEFIATPPAGFIAYLDGISNLNNAFTEGYWRFTSSGTPTANYSLSLTGNGFISYTIDEATRITGRDNGNTAWRALGAHGSQSGSDVSRIGVTNLNTTSFDFTLATGCIPTSLGYGYERNITIDNTKVSGGSNLYNFPVVINLSGQTFLRTAPTGQIINANGFDIIFTDDNYNKLDHQLEYYNGTTGDLIAWVRIPTLSYSSATVIKILYGNPQISADPSVTTVWDSHYKGVWHLDNGSLNDFTSTNKSGTSYNSPAYPSGRIYNSLGMNGSSQYVEVINDPAINFAGNITVSAWVNMTTGARDQKIAGNQNNSSGGYKFGIYSNNKVEFEIRNSANTPSLNRDVTGGTVLGTGQWYYLAGISSDVLDSIKTFVNGTPERPFKKTGILGAASNTLTIGKEPFLSSYYFAGMFDELRISNEVRSNGWLRTEYNNQLSPSTFYSIDASGVSSSNLPSASICNGPITLSFGSPSGGTYSGNPNIVGDVFTPPSAGIYSIIYTYNGGCGSTSITKDFIITDAPAAPAASNMEYCSNQITYLEATSGDNIQWYSGGILVSTANPFSTGQTLPGTYNYTVTQTVNGCESSPTAVSLTIYNGVTITTQPLPSIICAGNNATFTVVSAGYNETYRWQENGVNISNGGIYSGATTATLTLTNPGIVNNGKLYRCVVSSTCGAASVNSSTALLTVNPLPVATFSYAGTPYCPNAANPSPVFSGGGIAGTFSSTSGLVFVSSATGQINLSASIPGDYIVTNTIAASGGCGIVTATSPVRIIYNLAWTGAISTDWNVPGNWTCGLIPNSTTSVQIPNVANKPVLSGGGTGAVNNVVIDNSSSLTLSGNTLQISGTITNNGTFIATDGTIEMTGSSAQNIGASVFAGNTIKNLVINNSAGVTLLGALNISGILSAQSGNLGSGGNLTLLSTAVQTALINGAGSGNITGNVTMQRYLPSGYGYKYFSSPFQSAAVGEFGDDMALGPFSFYRYDENRTASGWVNYNNPVNLLNPAEGYAANFGSNPAPKTVDISGIVNNGNISVTLFNHNNTYTQGLNLVGNPYPSPIDWNAASGWTKTNIDNALYYFKASAIDQYGGSYRSYVNGISSDGIVNNIIPSMQGFFVHVSNGVFPVTGTLGMTNSVRITDLTHSFTKKKGEEPSIALLRLAAVYSDDISSEDPAVFYFVDKGDSDYDNQLDALKLMNTDLKVPNLYAVTHAGIKLSIVALPFLAVDSCKVPLGLKLNRAENGTIIIKILDVDESLKGRRIYLSDNVAGTEHDLLPDKEFTVSLEKGEYLNRFFLNFSNFTTGIEDNIHKNDLFSIYSSNGILKAEINTITGKRGRLVVSNLTGQAVFIEQVYETGSLEFKPGVVEGIYIITYTTGINRSSKKIFIQNP